jgi:hypothetical protein
MHESDDRPSLQDAIAHVIDARSSTRTGLEWCWSLRRITPDRLPPGTRKRLVELQSDFDRQQARSDALGLTVAERVEIINPVVSCWTKHTI